MKKLVSVFFLNILTLYQALSMADGQCQQGYQTIFQILDCNHKPVESVDVAITLCCNNQTKKGLTNAVGEIMFPFSHEDICARAIFGQANKLAGHGVCFKDPAKSDKTICKVSVVVCGE